MSSFTRFGTYNSVLPKEGPKTYPFNLDFTSDAEKIVDMTIELDAEHISFISGAFIDNRNNAAELLIKVERVGQIVRIPAGKQAYMPLLVGDSAILTITTTPANGLIVPIFVCNFPLFPAVF